MADDRIFEGVSSPRAAVFKKLRGLNRKRTIPIERPPLLGEVRAKFNGQRVLRGQRNGFP
jgi:hypothetical protein